MKVTQQSSHNTQPSAGYYLLTLSTRRGSDIVHSNSERAFIVSQLQDILTRRSLLEMPHAHTALSVHIDLLAFSIIRQNTQLVLFSLSHTSALAFGRLIVKHLKDYQSEWHTTPHIHPLHQIEYSVSLRRLTGAHHALRQSINLHLRHPDWEYDRYSSIGFYLHDRRGDWMHLWRMSRLYENNSDLYRLLLTYHCNHYLWQCETQENQEGQSQVPTTPAQLPKALLFAPLSHA